MTEPRPNSIASESDLPVSNRRGLLALSPILVFLLLYLVVSLCIGDFYRMPISVAFIAASIWGVAIYRGVSFDKRIETFSKAAGSKSIIYMILIFMLAGAFASLAKGIGAIDATVNATLRFLPPEFLLPGLFLAACIISFSIGTSVGTVVALAPLGVNLADAGGGDVALFTAAILGGAFFGDNLSIISDTTIAATRTQHVSMTAKLRRNFLLVLPAALVSLGIYTLLGFNSRMDVTISDFDPWLILPYFIVILLAVMGLHVMGVLLAGIIMSILIALINLPVGMLDLVGLIGSGIDSMGDLIIVTLLSAGMLGIIKATGGIDYLLQKMSRRIRGPRGAKAAIAALVASVNICTANNTITILTVGPLANKIARRYDISGARTASLLDTCSCIVQCLIPYGAQTLLAVGLAGLSPADPWPYLYYPWALIVMVVINIVVRSRK